MLTEKSISLFWRLFKVIVLNMFKLSGNPVVDPPDYLLCAWIVFSPYPNELVEVMSSQNRRIACQVIKVVHDDSHEEIQHQKGTEEDKGDEI